jgi:hypothetical protein
MTLGGWWITVRAVAVLTPCAFVALGVVALLTDRTTVALVVGLVIVPLLVSAAVELWPAENNPCTNEP